MSRFVACLAAVVCLASPTLAQDGGKQAFEEAFYLEQAERRYQEAARRYERILIQHAKDRVIAAKASLRLGLCQEQLKQCEQARATLKRVVKEFPAQATKANEALARLHAPPCKCKTPRPKSKTPRPKSKTPRPKGKTTPQPSALEKVLNRSVTLNFPDTPLSEVVSFFQDVSGGNLIYDPALEDLSVNLRLRDVSLRSALDVVAKQHDLSFATLYGVGILCTPRRLEELRARTWPTARSTKDKTDKEILAKLKQTQISLTFDATPVGEALSFLRDITRLNYVLSAKAVKHMRKADSAVTMRLKNVSVDTALRLMANLNDLIYRVEGGVVMVDLAPPLQTKKKKMPEPKAGERR